MDALRVKQEGLVRLVAHKNRINTASAEKMFQRHNLLHTTTQDYKDLSTKIKENKESGIVITTKQANRKR